jgi:hypothetical protein
MIFALAKSVQTKLQNRNCPIPVILDAPEKSTATGYLPERIVIEHDAGGDSFAGPFSQHKNPKQGFVRNVAAKATIYARSPKAGALTFEHRERAETLLDLVLVALREAVSESKTFWAPKSGGFFVPGDLEGSNAFAGAAYELKFEIVRGVQVLDWAGDAAPEATVGGEDGVGITNTVRASLDGDDFEQVIP